MGDPAAVVVGTPGTAARLEKSLARYGATTVHVAESAEAAQFLVTPAVDALQLAAREGAAAVLVSATTDGRKWPGASPRGWTPGC